MHHHTNISSEKVHQKSGTASVPNKGSTFFKPFIQPKLSINTPGDRYEQEADAMAEKVMRMPGNVLVSFFKPKLLPITPVQRKCAACEEAEMLQKKSSEIDIQRSPGEDTPGLNVPANWDDRYAHAPCLKIELTIPPATADRPDNRTNYGEANVQMIERGIDNPGDLSIDYANLWSSNYQLSTKWSLGRITKNLYEGGDSLLKPVRSVVSKIPWAGGFIGNKIKLDKPKLHGGDWDRYVSDQLTLTGLGGAVDRNNPTYNTGTGFTYTVNVLNIPFDENNIVKRLFRKPSDDGDLISQKCSDCEEEEKLQMHNQPGARVSNTAPAIVQDVISSQGNPLDFGTRVFMESRFGYDFENVQVHNDSLAHQSSKDINALAYTHGNHVVFGAGQYQPDTNPGKQLLAHELTHVVQQIGYTTKIHRKEGDKTDGIEIVLVVKNPGDEYTNQMKEYYQNTLNKSEVYEVESLDEIDKKLQDLKSSGKKIKKIFIVAHGQSQIGGVKIKVHNSSPLVFVSPSDVQKYNESSKLSQSAGAVVTQDSTVEFVGCYIGGIDAATEAWGKLFQSKIIAPEGKIVPKIFGPYTWKAPHKKKEKATPAIVATNTDQITDKRGKKALDTYLLSIYTEMVKAGNIQPIKGKANQLVYMRELYNRSNGKIIISTQTKK